MNQIAKTSRAALQDCGAALLKTIERSAESADRQIAGHQCEVENSGSEQKIDDGKYHVIKELEWINP
ncbi:MAG: hypothetical protein WEB53_05215 [Akkermansiaceae bacterium]